MEVFSELPLAKDCTNNTAQSFRQLFFLLCEEEGGVFSALSERDGEEPQRDVHLPGAGC